MPFPERGILVALTRWGSTSFSLLDVSRRVLLPVATKATGEMVASLAADRVAYLVREGVNPAKNSVEILDLRRGRGQRLTPASHFAILGLALAPNGARLAYAEMNLRWSRSQHLLWRLALADLGGYETRISLTSRPDNLFGEGIPVPFAWSSATEEIYLYSLLPFQGMARRGIWALKPDGSGLRRILAETSYTGHPRLSPDGGYLAYLTTKVEALPQGYTPSPGAPPGNVLMVMNLLTGEQIVRSQEPGAAFGVLAWSSTGKEILASRQAWTGGRFRDVALLRLGRDPSPPTRHIPLSPSTRVTDIRGCGNGSLFWVEEAKGARLQRNGLDENPATLLTLPDGKIQIVGCLRG